MYNSYCSELFNVTTVFLVKIWKYKNGSAKCDLFTLNQFLRITTVVCIILRTMARNIVTWILAVQVNKSERSVCKNFYLKSSLYFEGASRSVCLLMYTYWSESLSMQILVWTCQVSAVSGRFSRSGIEKKKISKSLNLIYRLHSYTLLTGLNLADRFWT